MSAHPQGIEVLQCIIAFMSIANGISALLKYHTNNSLTRNVIVLFKTSLQLSRIQSLTEHLWFLFRVWYTCIIYTWYLDYL